MLDYAGRCTSRGLQSSARMQVVDKDELDAQRMELATSMLLRVLPASLMAMSNHDAMDAAVIQSRALCQREALASIVRIE